MKGWYVVQTAPSQELRADENLRRQGYRPWLPKIRRTRRHARRVDSVLVPLFPGYLFVELDVAFQPWHAINGTFGVNRLICADGRPARLPPSFIEDMRQAADEEGTVPCLDAKPEIGSPVRVLNGMFADSVGTLLRLGDRDRVALLLSVLGREVTVTTTLSNLEPAI